MTLKLAETADGYASGGPHDARLRITGPIADARVQMMRATHEAIMIGIGTGLADDPALTVRVAGLDRRPWRVVLDTHLRLEPRSRLMASARDLPTLVIAGPDPSVDAETRLAGSGVLVARVGLDAGGHVDLAAALAALSERGITRVLSEGGPSVAARLIALGLADEVVVFTAEKPLGRPGVPSMSAETRAALADPSRYRPVETAAYRARLDAFVGGQYLKQRIVPSGMRCAGWPVLPMHQSWFWPPQTHWPQPLRCRFGPQPPSA